MCSCNFLLLSAYLCTHCLFVVHWQQLHITDSGFWHVSSQRPDGFRGGLWWELPTNWGRSIFQLNSLQYSSVCVMPIRQSLQRCWQPNKRVLSFCTNVSVASGQWWSPQFDRVAYIFIIYLFMCCMIQCDFVGNW